MNLQPNFSYCIPIQTLNIAFYIDGTELHIRTNVQTNKQTNRPVKQMDDPIARCPDGPFGPGHKNVICDFTDDFTCIFTYHTM